LRTLSNASRAPAALEKQHLLECILQDPKHSWLKYMDGRHSVRLCLLLYRQEASLMSKGKCEP
jgi:hypothetical protein